MSLVQGYEFRSEAEPCEACGENAQARYIYRPTAGRLMLATTLCCERCLRELLTPSQWAAVRRTDFWKELHASPNPGPLGPPHGSVAGE